MNQKKKNLNFVETLFFLSFLFIPLKLFTIKVSSFSLTFTRIILLVLIPLSLIHVFNMLKNQRPILINSTYFNVYILFLFFYAIISYFISAYLYSGFTYASRIHLSSISFFESFFLIPLLFFILVPSVQSQINIFNKVFKYLKYFIFIAFVQLFLDFVGIPISYETLGEAAPENRSLFMGTNFLRLNSAFGEPRVLAVSLIPIYLLNKIHTNTKFKMSDFLIIFIVGFLTFSTSFVQSIIVSIGLWSLFISRRFRIFALSSLSIITVVYLINFDLIRELVVTLMPRYVILFDILSPELIANIANISPEFKEQISDISFLAYILNGEFLSLNGILGNGLGSGHYAIDKIASSYFGLQHSGGLYGSRWLFYTMLLEIGVIGIIFLYLHLRNIYSKTSSRIRNYKLYVIIFFVTSLLGSTYFFILLAVYLSIESKTQKLNDN